jgi:site-specific recombinase XerD
MAGQILCKWRSEATKDLSNEADIAKAQEWLGRANVSTTKLYHGGTVSRRAARHFM